MLVRDHNEMEEDVSVQQKKSSLTPRQWHFPIFFGRTRSLKQVRIN